MRSAVRRRASARPAWRSSATTRPVSPIRAARCVVLPPGAAHRSSTASPGLGGDHACDGGRGARLRHQQPFLPQRRVERVERARRGPGTRGVRRRSSRAPAAAREVSRALTRSALARTAVSAGSLPAAIRARAASGAQGGEPELGDPDGIRVPQGRLGGRPVGQCGDHRRRLAGGAAQHGVDEARPAGRLRLGELDRLADGRVGGHAVEERELQHPEPQRGQHGGLEPRHRPPGQRLDHMVERGAALHGAVRQAHRERAVARVERVPPRFPVQGPVRVCSFLEDPPEHGVGAGARGGRRFSLVPGAAGPGRTTRGRCRGRPPGFWFFGTSHFAPICSGVSGIRRTFVHFGAETLNLDGVRAKAPRRTCR